MLQGAPDRQTGLVLPLIPASFGVLGGPPSFESVTRDQFPTDKKFRLSFIWELLIKVASACLHLHAVKGIMHGYSKEIVIPNKAFWKSL